MDLTKPHSFGPKVKLFPSLSFSQSLLKNPLIASCLNFICLFELILHNIKKLEAGRNEDF